MYTTVQLQQDFRKSLTEKKWFQEKNPLFPQYPIRPHLHFREEYSYNYLMGIEYNGVFIYQNMIDRRPLNYKTFINYNDLFIEIKGHPAYDGTYKVLLSNVGVYSDDKMELQQCTDNFKLTLCGYTGNFEGSIFQ